MMSPELALFYREVQNWISQGFPEHPIFSPDYAVCLNLSIWSDHSEDLTHELKRQFKKEGLNSVYPFNNGNNSEFLEELMAEKLWQNPKRLEWVRNHAKAV